MSPVHNVELVAMRHAAYDVLKQPSGRLLLDGTSRLQHTFVDVGENVAVGGVVHHEEDARLGTKYFVKLNLLSVK